MCQERVAGDDSSDVANLGNPLREHAVIGTFGASGIKELESLLASSVPECTPPSQNLLGSPPKRNMAANPLSHCSSWTRLACMSSQSNLDMLDTVVDEETSMGGMGRSIAIPVPQISRCSSGAHWVPTGSVSPGW